MSAFGSWPSFGSRLPEPQAKTWIDGESFHWEMVMPAQTKLVLGDNFQIEIHDAALRSAHAAGLLPIGEILITEEHVEDPGSAPLREGESLDAYMERRRQEAPFSSSPRIRVHAEVFLGANLEAMMESNEAAIEPVTEIDPETFDAELRKLLGE